jgi:hypothetical protein
MHEAPKKPGEISVVRGEDDSPHNRSASLGGFAESAARLDDPSVAFSHQDVLYQGIDPKDDQHRADKRRFTSSKLFFTD